MRKLTVMLLLIALFVTMMVPTAFAAGTSVSVSSATAGPNEKVTLNFTISGNTEGFISGKVKLSYDKTALRLDEITNVKFQGAPNVASGIANHGSAMPVTGDGVLFTATFTVLATKSGSYTVSTTVSDMANENGEEFAVTGGSGKITVSVPHTHAWDTKLTYDETNHWYACSGCDEKKDLAAHAWTLKSTDAATCIEKGTEYYECACGATKTETLEMLDHTYGAWTEVDKDNHKKTCTTPGCTETLTEAHKWDAGKVTTAATCSEDGEMTYTCATCNATKTEVIKANGEHVYTNWTKVDDEKHEGTCGCGEKTTAAHKWDAGKDTTAATCSKPGVKTYTCSECKGTKTEEIAATGKHDYTNSYKDNGDGTHTAYCACKEAKTEKHDFSVQGPITVKPTTSSEGKQTILCACGAKTEKTLPQLSADMDDVPMTGDITAQVTLAVVSMISLAAAAAYVFKRKIAK